jgi:cytochrome c oxidase assembly protein subunit 11
MPGPVVINARKNKRTAALAAGLVCAMVGLAYASVPLYDLFCRVTGFGGTTMVAAGLPEAIEGKSVKIRFDTNIDGSLPWIFYVEEQVQTIKIGEAGISNFVAKSQSASVSAGKAVYNVTPSSAGAYFNKVQCFCFTRQQLKPGEQVTMPIQYFIDPAILDDPDTRDIREITLSYTFYPAEQDEKPADPNIN